MGNDARADAATREEKAELHTDKKQGHKKKLTRNQNERYKR